jgi:3-oxoacyl-[acyl-carrier protein] reductase
MLLKNKVAIVTGASRGIGRAIALELASEGAKVVLAARSSNDLNEVALEIDKAGGQSLVVQTDVMREDQVLQLIKVSKDKFQRIDILVNNAGAIIRSSVRETKLAEWNEVIGVNLTGVFLCCQAVLNIMLEQKSGDIFNISSQRALNGVTNRSAYCASKAAVNIFDQSLREEIKNSGIRIHTLILAGIDTPTIRISHPEISQSNWIDAAFVGKIIAFYSSLPGNVDTPLIELRSLAD